MSRRKSEITGHMNERDFPHLVELELPPGGFRNKSLEFESFHREHGVVIRRGSGRHEGEQFHVRFCFPDAATADAFQERFGGKRLTYSQFKPGRPSGPRSRYQHSYPPRVVGGKIMTPADLRRWHEYLLENLKRNARGRGERVAPARAQAAAAALESDTFKPRPVGASFWPAHQKRGRAHATVDVTPKTISPTRIMKNIIPAVIGPQSSSGRHGSGQRL
jgi:hypothetical protein